MLSNSLKRVNNTVIIQQIYEQANEQLKQLVFNVNFEDYMISENEEWNNLEFIEKSITGCEAKCGGCKAVCTEIAKDHKVHKSDFHAYPAIKGWITKGQLVNDLTCEGIVFNNYDIIDPGDMYGQNEINAAEYFKANDWEVEGRPEIFMGDKNAFWTWALLHFKD